ncbi:hypothetical protein DCAR_0726939 [Daucus carota subsp. sativus]|uniref:EF-hand domain-containing protein n=1 Tax=Daucus carota subsp. sativus TaxID=79200 RepID=A0AAF0XIN3_DAUCS|nr:hypothetical protein DCAR_0726939 [Daucus carota subsp. sativus]
MGQVSVIIYITLAILLLLLISHSPTTKPSHHPHRRLKLRSNFSFSDHSKPTHIPFDPIVANIERKREDRLWEKAQFQLDQPAPGQESQPEWEDFMDAEDYLNDEDKFNVTNRIVLLFPKIDVRPQDGVLSEDEFTEWNVKQAQRETLYRSKRDMEIHDKNRDGLVSYDEYDPPSWTRKSDNDSSGYNMGWWKEEHFNASDADGDGVLNLTEFNNFLHPADSGSPMLFQWLCNEEVRERDTDKDGKLNFKEFFHGLFDLVRNYEDVGHNSSHGLDDSRDAPAKKLFAELDSDNDGYLSGTELLTIIGKLHPSEHYYAKQQADFVIQQADTDKDGHLTLAEMIDNPYVFYSAIFSEDEDDYGYHDEFR